MGDVMGRYFQEHGRVTVFPITVPLVNAGIMLPANRLRYALILPNSTATRIIWHFGENWPGQIIGMFSTTATPFGWVTEDEIGEAIRLPVWAWADTTVVTEITEISYDPTRYAQMMRYVDHELSKHGAS